MQTIVLVKMPTSSRVVGSQEVGYFSEPLLGSDMSH